MHIGRLDTYGDYVNTVWWVILNGFYFQIFQRVQQENPGSIFSSKTYSHNKMIVYIHMIQLSLQCGHIS